MQFNDIKQSVVNLRAEGGHADIFGLFLTGKRYVLVA
jgi:hypothetical protein